MKRHFAALAALALVWAPVACRGSDQARPKTDLYLLTSLPLLFGEGFGLEFAKADVITALERVFVVKTVDLPSQVPDGAALLMAQPRALPAEELVRLDGWVRGGGRLVLLADPLLEWPSERELGDRLRPPVMYPDTGLLRHWGLRLDAPETRGLVTVKDGGGDLVLQSPGRFEKIGGNCRLGGEGRIATCALGKGSVLIVADADWIDIPRMQTLDTAAVDGPGRLVAALASLGVPPTIE